MFDPLSERGLACADVRCRAGFGQQLSTCSLCVPLGLAIWQGVKPNLALAGLRIAYRKHRVPVALTAFANVSFHCTAPSLVRGLVLVRCRATHYRSLLRL